ncbi:MAG: DMT family transporter [Planctomycetota bacterium]
MLRYLLLIVGVFACSTAVIWIKLSTVHPVLLAGLRCLVAAAVLSPLTVRAARRHRATLTRRDALRCVVPGLILSVHFVTWNLGARMTLAANASLIVNLVPVVLPFFLFAVFRERLTRAELAGTALALVGVLGMTAADFRIDRTHFLGDCVCFGSMLFFCVYLILARRNRDVPSLWLYVPPLYLVSGLASTAAALFWFDAGGAFFGADGTVAGREVLLVLALGCIPTVVGHTILNVSMRHIRGQVVAVTNLAQCLFAAGLAFLALAETPHLSFYLAAALLLAGIVTALHADRRAGKQPTLPAAQGDRGTGSTDTP